MTRDDWINLWERVRMRCRSELSSADFDVLKDLTFVDVQDGVVILHTDSVFKCDLIESRYHGRLLELFKQESSKVHKLLIKEGGQEKMRPVSKSKATVPQGEKRLNKDYRFDNFILGDSNVEAFDMAQALSNRKRGASKYLYIYGGHGFGKTHLLQAMAWNWREKNGANSFEYVTADNFKTSFVSSVHEKKDRKAINGFKKRFRSVDLLLIDDLQWLGEAPKTQEELSHTINDLIGLGKRVVVAADAPLSQLRTINAPLRSRLTQAVSIRIRRSDIRLRRAILQRITEEVGLVLSDEVLDLMARKIKSSHRALSSAIHRVQAFLRRSQEDATPENIVQVLEDILRNEENPVTAELIIKLVAEHYNLSEQVLVMRKRGVRSVARARQIAMFLIKEYTDLSFSDIGRKMGGRDHATIMYGVRKIEKEIKHNLSLREDVIYLKTRLGNS